MLHTFTRCGLGRRRTPPIPLSQPCIQSVTPLAHPLTRPASPAPLPMQLCSESCEQGADFCHPLSTFQLRLNDQLVSDKRYIQRLATGSLVQSCAPRGPGVNFNRTELASLGRNNPANVRGARVHACVCMCGTLALPSFSCCSPAPLVPHARVRVWGGMCGPCMPGLVCMWGNSCGGGAMKGGCWAVRKAALGDLGVTCRAAHALSTRPDASTFDTRQHCCNTAIPAASNTQGSPSPIRPPARPPVHPPSQSPSYSPD